jgi:hypothetical protein
VSAVLTKRIEPEINLRLAGRRNFVVLPFHLDSQLFHCQAHLRADVLLRVRRADGKVTFLVANLVAKIRHLFATRIPDGFLAIH